MKKCLKHDCAKEYEPSKKTTVIGDERLHDAQTELQNNCLDPFGIPPMGWMPKDDIMSLVRKIDLETKAKNQQANNANV